MWIYKKTEPFQEVSLVVCSFFQLLSYTLTLNICSTHIWTLQLCVIDSGTKFILSNWFCGWTVRSTILLNRAITLADSKIHSHALAVSICEYSGKSATIISTRNQELKRIENSLKRFFCDKIRVKPSSKTVGLGLPLHWRQKVFVRNRTFIWSISKFANKKIGKRNYSDDPEILTWNEYMKFILTGNFSSVLTETVKTNNKFLKYTWISN